MSFKPGQSGNPGGRPAGRKNKTSAEIRLLALEILSENMPRFREILQNMDHDSFVRIMKDLLKHYTYAEFSPERLSLEQLQQLYEFTKQKVENEKGINQ